MNTTEITVDNGVNVEALLGARAALTEAPQAASFKWLAQCGWVNGTHSRTRIERFFGLGQDQAHRQAHTFDADHPEIFASQDNGPTPVEYVLVEVKAGGGSRDGARASGEHGLVALGVDRLRRPVQIGR